MNEAEVLIKILSAFDKGGTEAAKAALNEVAKTCGKTSQQTQVAASAFDLLSKNGRQGANAIKSLTQAARGGPGAIDACGQAVQQLAGMLGAGGPWMIAIGAAVAGIKLFVDHLNKQKEEAKKAAEEAKAAATEAANYAASLKDIENSSLADTVQQFEDLTSAAKDAADQASRVADTMLALEDAKAAQQIAEIEGSIAREKDPAMIERYRGEIAQIKSDTAQRKIAGQSAKLDAEESRLKGNVEAAQAAYDDAMAGGTGTGYLKRYNAVLADQNFHPELTTSKSGQAQRAVLAQDEARARLKGEQEGAKLDLDAANKALQNFQQVAYYQRQIFDAQKQTIAQQADTTSYKTSQAVAAAETKNAEDKAAKDAAEAAARQQAWIAHPGHLAAAQGLVRNAADSGLGDGTIVLGGVAGERAQAQGRAAIAEAGARIQAGENNQQVIDDLCATLDKIGSVITNMSALKSHLDAQVKSVRP